MFIHLYLCKYEEAYSLKPFSRSLVLLSICTYRTYVSVHKVLEMHEGVQNCWCNEPIINRLNSLYLLVS